MEADFSPQEIDAIYRVIANRRDMRHFLPFPVKPTTLARLLNAAHHAPSVGYMQPWRFIRIRNPELRDRIHQLVEQERQNTAEAMGSRKQEFLQQKVEGIMECAEVLVATLTDRRETHIFGRRTLPHMDMMSAACAIQNLWLAARAEGLGMGWVSFFDPEKLARMLLLPEGAEPLGILCLGHVEAFYPSPLLAETGWADTLPVSDILYEDQWGRQAELL